VVPSDTSAATVQVQVKNPAGISPPIPITVQAAAPQFMTTDGKHVAGVHADGTSLSSSAPAVPGETIFLYGTGFATATPALVSGQLPAQTVSLTTLPGVTIAGTAAAVSSGTIPAGIAGICQLSVQVPAATPNGDQPVAIISGTFTSVPVLLPVQR